MVICITNRKLCSINFLERIEFLAQNKPKAIILREKDLNSEEYFELAKNVKEICNNYNITFIINSFSDVAKRLNVKNIHLPLPELLAQKDNLNNFTLIGTSVHSVEDAIIAEKAGASYLIAGHIFQTDCKKDLAPRGLEFLSQVTQSVNLPVYAIGGINPQNTKEAIKAGAKAVCIMSSAMNGSYFSTN